jgi:hypothetical protein
LGGGELGPGESGRQQDERGNQQVTDHGIN